MVWRCVVIDKPARLRREHFSLVVAQAQDAFVPFEDIAVIVLHSREITLTHPVLAACAEYGIALFSTGDNHQPNGVFMPFLSHSRTVRMMRLQMDLDRPTVKRCWAKIVKQKIENQAFCLRKLALPQADRLDSYARRVVSGDTGMLEAQASAIYFPALFSKGFTRSQDDWTNSALNYGYAILRGAITRGIVAHGLMPSLGIFHSSEQNAFNLADDIIEPFRPLIDLYVAKNRPIDLTLDLTPTQKASLVDILNIDVAMPRGVMSVLSAIEQCVESFVRMYDGGSEALLELPTIKGLARHHLDY